MNNAKERTRSNNNTYIKVSLKASLDEIKTYEDFFKNNPVLKRGEKVKDWIFRGINNEIAGGNENDQAIDLRDLIGRKTQ